MSLRSLPDATSKLVSARCLQVKVGACLTDAVNEILRRHLDTSMAAAMLLLQMAVALQDCHDTRMGSW